MNKINELLAKIFDAVKIKSPLWQLFITAIIVLLAEYFSIEEIGITRDDLSRIIAEYITLNVLNVRTKRHINEANSVNVMATNKRDKDD